MMSTPLERSQIIETFTERIAYLQAIISQYKNTLHSLTNNQRLADVLDRQIREKEIQLGEVFGLATVLGIAQDLHP